MAPRNVHYCAVEITFTCDGSEENTRLNFEEMRGFEPERVTPEIPQLKAMLTIRNLLHELNFNILDNATFRRELESLLHDPTLSNELRSELSALAPKDA